MVHCEATRPADGIPGPDVDVEENPKKNGASEGIRTLDTHVGNVMLYQAELRSLPEKPGKTTGILSECKPCFAALFPPHLVVILISIGQKD
jgi:hypothetical protein